VVKGARGACLVRHRAGRDSQRSADEDFKPRDGVDIFDDRKGPGLIRIVWRDARNRKRITGLAALKIT
jgi:hypothetical protein